MRSRLHEVPEGRGVERALVEGVCGMGGRLATPPDSLAAAVSAVSDAYGEPTARRLERFAAAPGDAFVWTRDVDGLAWLGRLQGPWYYDATPAAHAADLVHVRPCRWMSGPVAERLVPPAVLHTFRRGGLNWQQTHDPDVSRQSREIWNAEG